MSLPPPPPPPAPTTASTPPPPPVTGTATPPPPMVVVDRVSKWFADLVAVSDVSFSVGPGVTALLGPNGAGKSTLMRMLCGLTPPAQGRVLVLGQDPRRDIDVTRHIGLAPQQESVFEPLTAFEFVRLAAVLHGLPEPEHAAVAALATVELDPQDKRPLPTYSKGMRQRVKIAQAIVHDPYVLVLDEPLTGLDPRQRVHMIDLVHRLGDQGKCVLVSSHVLDEVERFGSRVLVIVQGRLAAQGDFRAIRDLMNDKPLRVRIHTDRPRALASRLIAESEAASVGVDGETVIVETSQPQVLRTAIAPLAQAVSARLFEVKALDDDLESVFRYLVERR